LSALMFLNRQSYIFFIFFSQKIINFSFLKLSLRTEKRGVFHKPK
jgi:hypothetical protein